MILNTCGTDNSTLDLLWENTTGEVGDITIPIDRSKYSRIYILFQISTTSGNDQYAVYTWVVPSAFPATFYTYFENTAGCLLASRGVTWSSTGLYIQPYSQTLTRSASGYSTIAYQTSNPNFAIPCRIYGMN